MKKDFSHREIEKKWQDIWEKKGVFRVSNRIGEREKKYYLLEMFPYPSGELHMGHVSNYAIGDTYARYLRRNGYKLLYPMGYDAMGLPAENAAIKKGIIPSEWIKKCIANMMVQQRQLGLSYDWERLVNTSESEYYRWNQWIFIKFLEKGLAYKKKAAINWCPSCGTTLANEQVENGKCWRCASDVEIRIKEQWYFKITEYAEELLNDLDGLYGWPEAVKIQQRNWIGRSSGAIVRFKLEDSDYSIPVFTTRPDTLYGSTFLLLAPQHPEIMDIASGNKEEIQRFINETAVTSIKEKEVKEKKGIYLGINAVNPLNGRSIPVYIANFVFMEYGTGAIMSVPAHDQRDFEFAKKYGLEIVEVIRGSDTKYDGTCAYEGPGKLINSDKFSGMESRQAIEEITSYLEETGKGAKSVQYKLRDWLISRQRYWGTPIPVVYCEKCGIVPVKECDLPVKLPGDVEFTGKGNPLETSSGFRQTSCPECGGTASRETDTMDTFVDSSWYFLRYINPHTSDKPFKTEEVNSWLPVDQYIGGIEHAVLHLLYSRFFTRALCDLGLVNFREPFRNLLCQGMVVKDGSKMSKSRGNVVTADEINMKYGADTARLFILFASPPEKDLEWSDEGINGCYRFLKKLWRMVQEETDTAKKPDEGSPDDKFLHLLHNSVKSVTIDISRDFHFNTAIARIMELVNGLRDYPPGSQERRMGLKTAVNLIGPFSPHIASEMWELLGGEKILDEEGWPEYDEKIISRTRTVMEIPVTVNGKLREKLLVSPDTPDADILKLAKEKEKVRQFIDGRKMIKEIYIPKKIINFVVKEV